MLNETSPEGLTHGRIVRALTAGAFSVVECVYLPGIRIGPHVHEHSKISLVVSGGTEERHRDTDDRYGPGWAVIKPIDAEHSNHFGPSGLRTLVITRRTDDSEIGAAWNQAVRQYRWVGGGPLVRAMFVVARAIREPSDVDCELLLEERLADVEAALIRAPEISSSSPRWLCGVRDRLHAYGAGHVPATRMAEDLGIHPVYLSRAFRLRFGCNMTEYVRRLRVRRAATLLADRWRSVAQVAQEAGFADHAHLCRVFKSQMGITPGAYRRMADCG